MNCSLRLPRNARRCFGAELSTAASQMPVCGATQFALSHLLKFIIPRLNSELPQMMECCSHINICLWLILSTSIFCHLDCPFIFFDFSMARNCIAFALFLSTTAKSFPQILQPIFSSCSAGPSEDVSIPDLSLFCFISYVVDTFIFVYLLATQAIVLIKPGLSWVELVPNYTAYSSDFQPGFRGTPGFCEHLPRVPQLASKK